jgi:Lipocalin-like domain
MTDSLAGTWSLVAWRRIAADGTVNYPLGEEARGLLSYADNGRMTVQITGANRAELATDDPLGGDETARAEAYSTYLAYFGTYAVQGQNVVHRIEGSLYQNWAGQSQVRPFTDESGELVLRTPPMRLSDGTTVVNELAWTREKS